MNFLKDYEGYTFVIFYQKNKQVFFIKMWYTLTPTPNATKYKFLETDQDIDL